MLNKKQIWTLIESYRTAGGSEEHYTYKDMLDILIDELLEAYTAKGNDENI